MLHCQLPRGLDEAGLVVLILGSDEYPELKNSRVRQWLCIKKGTFD